MTTRLEDRIRDSQPANCIRSSLFLLPETDIFKGGKNMSHSTYSVLYDNEEVLARGMTLNTAMLLAKTLIQEWYNEPGLAITILRETPKED